MEPRKKARRWILAVMLAGLLGGESVSGWPQETPASSPPESGPSGSTILAGVGAVLGSMIYAPVKGLLVCPVMGLAAGATYAATGGEKETPNYLLRVGCTGTYFISPAMVQGQESFRAYDAP
jgi:hypothetical protein